MIPYGKRYMDEADIKGVVSGDPRCDGEELPFRILAQPLLRSPILFDLRSPGPQALNHSRRHDRGRRISRGVNVL
jgi:hypothetical protein